MHKIMGKFLCNLYRNFHLTKCGGCGIIEIPAEPGARGAMIIPYNELLSTPKMKKYGRA